MVVMYCTRVDNDSTITGRGRLDGANNETTNAIAIKETLLPASQLQQPQSTVQKSKQQQDQEQKEFSSKSMLHSRKNTHHENNQDHSHGNKHVHSYQIKKDKKHHHWHGRRSIFERFYPPTHHHHQGHNLNSSNESSSASSCSIHCIPTCSCSPQYSQPQRLDGHEHLQGEMQGPKVEKKEQRPQHQEQIAEEIKKGVEAQTTCRHSRFTALASSVASTFASNSHTHCQTQQKQPKSRFSLFRSLLRSQPQSQNNNQRRHQHHHSGPLLYGTMDYEQHEAKIIAILHICNLFNEGYDLNEYSQHGHHMAGDASERGNDGIGKDIDSNCHENATNAERDSHSSNGTRARYTLSSIGFEFRLKLCRDCCKKNDLEQCSSEECAQIGNCPTENVLEKGHGEPRQSNHLGYDKYGKAANSCPNCITRLYHVPSSTVINNKNREIFIADGKMYDAVSDICQAAAQEIMAEMCNLVWVTICDGKGGGLAQTQQKNMKVNPNTTHEWPRDELGNIVVREPIRALVGRHQHDDITHNPPDTLLVATGKGKVRAGIFSREHLLTTGLEPSTAIPMLLEARNRGMNCVVIDPNARGDREGMETFEASVRSLFECQCALKEEEIGVVSIGNRNEAIIPKGCIYVLAHSAAGE